MRNLKDFKTPILNKLKRAGIFHVEIDRQLLTFWSEWGDGWSISKKELRKLIEELRIIEIQMEKYLENGKEK